MSDALIAHFTRFAEQEARGHSPLYEALALGVAGDRKLIGLVEALPPHKRQPNLLFAAYRQVCGVPDDFPDFRRRLMRRASEVVAVMMARSTQTNEPGRCAVLLPLLARLHQPLALLEVGASAGLCLIPDHYAYDYDGVRVGTANAGPVFSCHANDATPIPDTVPRVVWRAGLDLSPLSPHDPDHVSWLENLIWPDQPDRLTRFRAALDTARAHPVRVWSGDLRTDLQSLLSSAPVGPTIVVYHTAVLGYVRDPAEKAAFRAMVWDNSAVWISNEAPHVYPEIAAAARRPGPPGSFLLAVNGVPVAWTDPHGAWIDWLGVE